VADDTKEGGVDWWAQLERIASEESTETLARWRIDQGLDKYVTSMQGPPPSVDLPEPRGSGPTLTAYRNAFGDVEVEISEGCVLQFVRSYGTTDLERNLPALIRCSRNPGSTFDFPAD
jgi:hypothetical protein